MLRKKITMSVSETYEALLLKVSEMIQVLNINNKLWYETKNILATGMIWIIIIQLLIVGLLVFK